jgi:DNA-binding MarR family transcriptional regulator
MAMDYLRQHGALVLDHRFRRLSEHLLKTAEEIYLALGLPFRARWASTYLLLEELGSLGITEIAERLRLTHPGIIGITDEMRDAGIVAFLKDREDARRRTVTLTPKGRALAARLHATWAALQSAQRRRFSDAGCDIVAVLNTVEDGLVARPLAPEVVARVERGRRGKARVATIAGMMLLASLTRPAVSQAPDPPTPAVRSSLVQAIADSLVNGYIYEDRAHAMADSLRAALSRGAFDAAPDRRALARTIGEFLQRISLDRHLSVRSDSGAGSVPAGPVMRRVSGPAGAGNDGFGRVEILPDRIGYLELFGFSGDPAALHKADSLMAAFAGVTALIIDLRHNGGGGAEMVRQLSTWLFDKPTHLVSTFARGMDQPRERWTLDQVPGKRLSAVPVYILTSHHTFSAAESFTFGLKAAGRVTIVGERTGGGGHFGRVIPLTDGFSMFLPIGRTYDPRTNQGWEAEGIAPDVAVPQEQALEKALELARKGGS